MAVDVLGVVPRAEREGPVEGAGQDDPTGKESEKVESVRVKIPDGERHQTAGHLDH